MSLEQAEGLGKVIRLMDHTRSETTPKTSPSGEVWALVASWWVGSKEVGIPAPSSATG
jgi:hypothetical protein